MLHNIHATFLLVIGIGVYIGQLRCLAAAEEPNQDSLVVQTPSGAVRGRLEPVVYGLSVRQFRGIPYAEPPVGELRFAKPQPAKPWTGVRVATEHGAVCPQISKEQFLKMLNIVFEQNLTAAKVPQSEDCLFLNVYTPKHAKPGDKRAVMVWVHGGGMSMGSSSAYDPSVIVALHDVIVVTVNYRLGVLGFFNIRGTDVKGNYGMHDQVLALRWVQENIASFGGNPGSVTIFGESAGGMCVSLHLLSPLSKGLFHRVIAQSGSSASDAFIGIEVKDTELAELFAKHIGCAYDDKVMACLRSKSTEDVFKGQENITYPRYMGEAVLTAPVLDGDFLPDGTRKLLGEGRVNPADVILGVTANEGGLFAMIAPGGMREGLTQQGFKDMIKHGFRLIKGQNSLVEDAVLFEYTDHRDPDNNATNRQGFMDMFSDLMFAAPASFEAQALARNGMQPYFYVIEVMPDFANFPEWLQSVHGVEIPYAFGAPLSYGHSDQFVRSMASRFSTRDVGLSLSIMKMWTDFAKHGDPNHSGDVPVTWPRYNATAQAHLVIGFRPRVGYKFRADKAALWNEFLPKLTEVKPTAEQQDEKDKNSTGKEEL